MTIALLNLPKYLNGKVVNTHFSNEEFELDTEYQYLHVCKDVDELKHSKPTQQKSDAFIEKGGYGKIYGSLPHAHEIRPPGLEGCKARMKTSVKI